MLVAMPRLTTLHLQEDLNMIKSHHTVLLLGTIIALGLTDFSEAQAPAPKPKPKPAVAVAPPSDPRDTDTQIPIGTNPQQSQALPHNAGFDNPGGLVDSTALQQEAEQGVHYHYHYYAPGSTAIGNAKVGYAQAGYVDAVTASMPVNPFLQAPYGPGNPAPMNTLAGEYQNSENAISFRGPAPNPGLIGAGAGDGGQAWSYGGGIGAFNPYANGGSGYVEGFND